VLITSSQSQPQSERNTRRYQLVAVVPSMSLRQDFGGRG